MNLLSLLLILASPPFYAESDRQGDALYDMKLKLNAIGNQLSDWHRNQVNPCTWNAVICDVNSNVIGFQLAFNHLSSQIPDQLFQVARYNFSGNNLNCGTNFSQSCASDITAQGLSHNSKVGVILGSIGVVGFLLIGVVFLLCKGRKRGSRPEDFVDVAGEDDRRITFYVTR